MYDSAVIASASSFSWSVETMRWWRSPAVLVSWENILVYLNKNIWWISFTPNHPCTHYMCLNHLCLHYDLTSSMKERISSLVMCFPWDLTWLRILSIRVPLFPQKRQENTLLGAWTVRKCLDRSPRLKNALPHTWHAKLFSEMWLLLCALHCDWE